jgi:hypothetical protein
MRANRARYHRGMAEEKGSWINRSGLFIISFQLEGLCTALRMVIPNGLEPKAGTTALLKKLHDDFESLSTGRSLKDFPPIDESLSPVDVLVVAEVLRLTVLSFLSPDELSEQKQTFGLSPRRQS